MCTLDKYVLLVCPVGNRPSLSVRHSVGAVYFGSTSTFDKSAEGLSKWYSAPHPWWTAAYAKDKPWLGGTNC